MAPGAATGDGAIEGADLSAVCGHGGDRGDSGSVADLPACAGGAADAARGASGAACTAAPPARGQSFSGTVLQVIDGRTLCVASGPTPDQWVRVRLSDADASLPRGALMATAFSREVTCVAGLPDAGGVTAVCIVDGRSVGRAAASPDATAQAADWR